MESGLELEYAFDTEDGADGGFAAGGAETSGNRTAGNSGQQGNNGLPEGFVIGDSDGIGKQQAADRAADGAGVQKPPVPGGNGKSEAVADSRKIPSTDRRGKAADSISYRLFHWKFSVEQKEEVKRAMAVRVPKEVILSYFYPETSVVRMMEIRRQYE